MSEDKKNLPALPTKVDDLAFSNDDLLSVAVAKAEGRLSQMDRELKTARKLVVADMKANTKSFYDLVQSLMKQYEADEAVNQDVNDFLDKTGYTPLESNYNHRQTVYINSGGAGQYQEVNTSSGKKKKKPTFEAMDNVNVQFMVTTGQSDTERYQNVYDEMLQDFVVTEHKPYPAIPAHIEVNKTLSIGGYNLGENKEEITDLPPDLFSLISDQNKLQERMEELDARSMEVRHELQNMTSYERAARASLAEATIKRQEGGEEYLRIMEDTEMFGQLKQLQANVQAAAM